MKRNMNRVITFVGIRSEYDNAKYDDQKVRKS